jgi:hypothetical protein
MNKIKNYTNFIYENELNLKFNLNLGRIPNKYARFFR